MLHSLAGLQGLGLPAWMTSQAASGFRWHGSAAAVQGHPELPGAPLLLSGPTQTLLSPFFVCALLAGRRDITSMCSSLQGPREQRCFPQEGPFQPGGGFGAGKRVMFWPPCWGVDSRPWDRSTAPQPLGGRGSAGPHTPLGGRWLLILWPHEPRGASVLHPQPCTYF